MAGWLRRLFSRQDTQPGTLFGLPREDFEFGYQFDAATLRDFLEQLNRKLAIALPVNDLLPYLMATPVDEERIKQINVRYQGQIIPLEIRAEMDEPDEPEVHFSTPSDALGEAVNTELLAFIAQAER